MIEVVLAATLQSAYVTDIEALAAFDKIENAIKQVLGVPPSTSARSTGKGKAASRLLILSTISSLFSRARNVSIFTPRPLQFDRSRLTLFSDPSNEAKLEELIRWGAIAPVGPLAIWKKPGLTISEFGDALGYLTLRIAELTHTPSIKWSPYLQLDR